MTTPSYNPLACIAFSIAILFSSCTSTTTHKQPRRPQARLDLAGNQIREKLYFAGFVATGFGKDATGWADKNLKYGQHIINLPGKGTPASKQKLEKFNNTVFQNFSHPEFDVSLNLSEEATKPKAFVFAIDNERIVTEGSGSDQNLIVDLTGQIIVFDWNDRIVLASYPLVFSAKDVHNSASSDLTAKMERLYYFGWGEQSTGFLDYFVKYLKEKVSLTFYFDGLTVNKVGVENVEIEAKALAALSKAGISSGEYKQQFAQKFMTYLAKNQNLAIVPYGSVDENGERKLSIVPGGDRMAGLFTDNSANELAIPKADFPFDLSLRGFKEVEMSRSTIDKVVAYASFAKVKVSNSNRDTVYFEDDFKKILTRHLPLNYKTDSWRWLDSSLLILMDEITKNMNRPDSKWCKAQSNGTTTRRALQSLYDGQLSTCLSPLPIQK
jgi:hypothetical protein